MKENNEDCVSVIFFGVLQVSVIQATESGYRTKNEFHFVLLIHLKYACMQFC
jgi:hypothetical protein